MNQFIIAFGANMGSAVGTLQLAFIELKRSWNCLGFSSLYQTDPVGGVEQDDYVNAVAAFEGVATPREVLTELHRVEDQYGRTREIRWGPRTLDLDLIAMWEAQTPVILETDSLTVPHPRANERSFVTAPWSEIELPDFMYVIPAHGDIRLLDSATEFIQRLPESLDS
jgi:2-amino-4-hydroxy-6-hydroxymethyldihydropteridine diphosphokinase